MGGLGKSGCFFVLFQKGWISKFAKVCFFLGFRNLNLPFHFEQRHYFLSTPLLVEKVVGRRPKHSGNASESI